MKNYNTRVLSLLICLTVVSCLNKDVLEREEISGFSFRRPSSWAVDTSGPRSINTEMGRIITDKNDTIIYEYGDGIHRVIEIPKTVVPVSQQRYWNSVGLSSEIVLSNTPREDLSLNIHSTEYYLKDTIENKEVIWVFAKKFRKGKTGASFINPQGKDLSIYADTIRAEVVDEFIKLIKSVRLQET